MPKKRMHGPCSVLGCGKTIEVKYWCQEHYVRQWKYGRLEKVNTGQKRIHPLYTLWFERKSRNSVVDEWMDFWSFAQDVGEKPGPDYALVKKIDGLWGPNNFEWREHLRRQKGESKKDWHARKWASRRQRFPMYEEDRWMRRKYGISIEQYRAILESQDGKCAICEQAETSIEYKTSQPKNLAIDHSHTSGAIRGLLCFRCNGVIGKIDESMNLLKKMEAYLLKHRNGFT